jgi:hypothetical protein
MDIVTMEGKTGLLFVWLSPSNGMLFSINLPYGEGVLDNFYLQVF